MVIRLISVLICIPRYLTNAATIKAQLSGHFFNQFNVTSVSNHDFLFGSQVSNNIRLVSSEPAASLLAWAKILFLSPASRELKHTHTDLSRGFKTNYSARKKYLLLT